MAGEDRAEAYPLIRRLEDEPYRFDFFQAVRRLDCLQPRDIPRIGLSRRPADDPLRFAQKPSLAFAPSTVSAYERRPGGQAPKLYQNFFGLLGPNGPMPLHITEYVYSRLHNYRDPAFARFLDVFHHRMVSLFYRCWASSHQTVSYDRPEDDRFALYIGALFGMGMESMRERDAVPDLAKLHYSGRLLPSPRHADGLAAIIQDYFRIPTAILEFVGRWAKLPDDCCCRLGETPETGTLGHTAVVGSMIWDCQLHFRIRLGAMAFRDYERMLPGGDSLRRLQAWVRNYIGDELGWDTQLVLKADEVPQTQLGSLGRLGWSTWLISQPVTEDADDLILHLVA